MTTDTPAARPLLTATQTSAGALRRMATFHPEVVDRVARALGEHPLVVVGMAQNPHVKNVRAALKTAGIAFEYIEYGSYFSKWGERLAIKLWSGFPTFPQVFARGTLVGGEDLTVAAIADGSLKKMLADAEVHAA